MAQTLKPEVRELIIASAKKEFLENGYENASMRTIAKNSNMTVGNLYRYFENKEDIHSQIISSTLKKMNNAYNKLSDLDLSLETRVFDVRFNTFDLENKLDEFAHDLVDIYFDNKTEFNIVFLQSTFKDNMIDWLIKLTKNLISVIYGNNIGTKGIDLLSASISNSFFEGLRLIFFNNDSDDKNLVDIVNLYFNSYVYMLNNKVNNK